MNKHLKTLLIVSAILMPISACSGNLHGKNDGAMGGANCKITRNIEKAQKHADKTLKELDEAAASTTDVATKKRLKKLAKDADKLSHDIGQCKKICDTKGKDAKATPAAKAKSNNAVKPAAQVPAAKQPEKK